MNLPGLLLRWMLLVALVLNAPALARASSPYAFASGPDHCSALHSSALPGCCDDSTSAGCETGECECPPACLGLAVTRAATLLSPWREVPPAGHARQRAPPPLNDPLRPPIG
ncbi:hypothetical protein [uncultured Stenotrophomonas sp.]|uniref:hypothetical protein n=1 Tax=uncultured Stenotrophomonas sp. TaxID=165438 RepID=UPI0025F7D444|nr:hypothetical protein [uncultured Stenotrophomonas sp.]